MDGQARTSFVLLFIALCFAPIMYGGNKLWAWGFLETVVLLAFVIYILQQLVGFMGFPIVLKQNLIVVILVLLSIIFPLLQLFPMPEVMMESFAPSNLNLIKSYSLVPEDRIYTVSLDKGLTYHSIHQQVLYAFGFLLTLILVNSRKRIILLLSSIMILGVVISFFSIAREIVNYLSPLSTAKHFPPITGTFINKNHFAAFLNMSISANIALILLVNQNSEYMGRGLVKIFNIALDWHKHLFLYLSILCIALVLTESRGAIASLTFAVAVVSLAVMLSTKAREWHSHNLKYLLIFGTVAIFAFGWGFLLSQLDGDNGSWAMRKALWTMTAEMAKDYWVFGAGAGVYELVFPVYNAGITGQNVVYTHNDYLQMLVEKGIFGLTLFILIILVALKSAFTEIFHSQNPAKCAFSIGATVAILSMSVHGFVDFNFNIPSNALYFYIFLALAITSGANSRIRTRAIHRHS